MRPAENPLARARQAAHINLRQQAVERAGKLLNNSAPGQVTAPMLRAAGHPAAAASLFESRHPAAMAGQANIPNWVMNQMAHQVQAGSGGVAGNPVSPMLPQQIQRIGAFGPHGGGISQILPRLPEQPTENLPGSNPLVHLGGGIFLHALTGELHGLGQQYAPRPAGPLAGTPMGPGPIHPGMAQV